MVIYVLEKWREIDILEKLSMEVETKRILLEFKLCEDENFVYLVHRCVPITKNNTWHVIDDHK